LNKITDLKVHPRGESKTFNIARSESKEKNLQGGKIKLAHITEGYQPIYPFLYYPPSYTKEM
jgi:hypothetical protein